MAPPIQPPTVSLAMHPILPAARLMADFSKPRLQAQDIITVYGQKGMLILLIRLLEFILWLRIVPAVLLTAILFMFLPAGLESTRQ